MEITSLILQSAYIQPYFLLALPFAINELEEVENVAEYIYERMSFGSE